MKIFVDENIPAITCEELRRMGYDIMDIRGTEKEGFTDQQIWEMVIEEGRLLVTTDKGFSFHRDEEHSGILIVCLNQPNRKKIQSRVMQIISEFTEKEWKGLLVIAKDRVQSLWRSKEEFE